MCIKWQTCIHLIPPAVLPFPLGSSAFLWVTASLQLAPLLMPRPVSPHPLHHHPLFICYFHPIPKFRWFFSLSSSYSLNIGGLLTCVPVFSSLSQTLTLPEKAYPLWMLLISSPRWLFLPVGNPSTELSAWHGSPCVCVWVWFIRSLCPCMYPV